MTTTEERGSPTAGQRAAKAGAKHLGRKIGWVLGAKIGFWVAVVLVLLLLVMAAGAQVANQQPSTAGGAGPGPGGMEWDPGNIMSDAVFYNSQALPDEAAVQAALDEVSGSCSAPTCLRLDTYQTFPATSTWCTPYPVPQNGNPERYAVILLKLAQVCGVNPQVAIVMIQKESQGLTRSSPPAALTGFGCPDTGPGGSANCDAASAGVWAQTLGMFTSFAKLHQDASSVNYPEGQTSDILWNVAETGCGSAPVTVANRATATLYTYTPYQVSCLPFDCPFRPIRGDSGAADSPRVMVQPCRQPEWVRPTGPSYPSREGSPATPNPRHHRDSLTRNWVRGHRNSFQETPICCVDRHTETHPRTRWSPACGCLSFDSQRICPGVRVEGTNSLGQFRTFWCFRPVWAKGHPPSWLLLVVDTESSAVRPPHARGRPEDH